MPNTRKNAPQINAGSMADIAFLLLIFFLVTTSIMSDKGLLVVLPPWEESIETEAIKERNLLKVLINADDKLLVRNEQIGLLDLKTRIKDFILNPAKDPRLAARPNAAVVSLQHDKGTSYSSYLNVYNELKAAYKELWEAQAQLLYKRAYNSLPKQKQQIIRAQIPLVISEAEPTDYAADLTR